MKDISVNDYSNELHKLGIEHTLIEHIATKDYRDILDKLHITTPDCVPTLILKADNEFIAVVFRADTRIDFKKIKKLLHIRDLCMATPEEFTKLTGLEIGAARVYNPDIKTIIDEKVFEKEYLTGGSGSFACSIRYKTEDLKKIPLRVIADITK